MNKKSTPTFLLIAIALFLLILSACGGADSPLAEEVQDAAEVVEEAVEEMAEEAAEDDEAMMEEEAVGDFSADRSEGDGVSPVEPASGSKSEPTRAPAEVALAEADEEVRVVEEVEVVKEVEVELDLAADRAEVDEASKLTAGEIDDNEFWDDYLLYLRQFDAAEYIFVDVVERHVVQVIDANGLPVVGEQVDLQVGNQIVASRHTTSNGELMIFPNTLELPNQNSEIDVVLTETGDAITVTFGDNQREWELRSQSYKSVAQSQLDVLFLIDATGSMADEIEQLTDNMIAISQQIDALPAQADVRYGLSVYRDQEEPGAIESFEFVSDVQTFTNQLQQIEARGGGDYPEDLVLGMNTALNNEWRVENTVSLIFLIADAPPHLDYDYGYTYADNMAWAAEKGIKLFSIASSGLDPQGEFIFRQMSQYTGGRFIFLTYGEEGAGSTGEKTDVNVDPEDYTVEALDELIVNIVEEELANLSQISAE